MPHMLIAGTTGSGKSVCINSMLISLLYKSTPEEVRLIMVDPKMVELGNYNGIPHLLIPVVTDPKKAAGALNWAVGEMERRYKLFADHQVRNLVGYNDLMRVEKAKAEAAAAEGETATAEQYQVLPQIVIVIDELADLMMVAAKEVENSICRIAQKARAAGMHLVVATQRPSSDVITGIMKANIPSRIAFAVASQIESRIILDTTGAEKLIGKGDMLYAPLGEGKPLRVQGCFISNEEIESVIEKIKETSTAEYSEEILEHIERQAEQTDSKSGGSSGDPGEDEDEMIEEAIDVIMEASGVHVHAPTPPQARLFARRAHHRPDRGTRHHRPVRGLQAAPDPHFARGMAGNEAEKKYADRIKQTNKTQQFIYGGFYHEEDQYRRAVLQSVRADRQGLDADFRRHGGKVEHDDRKLGRVGVMWGKPSATCYIRQSRYTKTFVDDSEFFTLTVLKDGCRDALNLLGSKSGRDMDKMHESGLTPVMVEGQPTSRRQSWSSSAARRAKPLSARTT